MQPTHSSSFVDQPNKVAIPFSQTNLFLHSFCQRQVESGIAFLPPLFTEYRTAFKSAITDHFLK